VSLLYVKRKSVLLAGTALLGAIAAILDWTFKLANLKIPFPLMTDLKFDLLGIPMVLALLLFGLLSGIITCSIGAASIAIRGPPNAVLKFLAELSTIFGIYLVLRIKGLKSLDSQRARLLGAGTSIIVRVLVMIVANLLLLPLFFSQAFDAVLLLSPVVAVFNVLQGAVSALGGLLVYEAVTDRLPSLKPA